MLNQERQRDLRTLPKAHLHLHLEAAAREATLHELGAPMGFSFSPVENFQDFAQFSRYYEGLLAVFSVPANLGRLFQELAEDAADEGVVYVEAAVCPQFSWPAFGSVGAALDFMIAQAQAASAATGVEIGLMVTADRTAPPEEAEALAVVAAARTGAGVVAFGLASDEARFPGEPFERAFAIARAAGLACTPHAGELRGPEAVAHAVHRLGASRVQHGISVATDPALAENLRNSEVCFDVCPTSNVLLSLVPSLPDHPLRRMLDAGLRCSINADDPVIFRTSILREYELCRQALRLTDEQLAVCARASIEFSGATPALRERALVTVDRWLATAPA